MRFNTTVLIQPFDRAHSLSLIDFLSKVLPDFGITEIDVLYGWAWGNEIFNWETRTIALGSLNAEIEHVEMQGFGKIGDDDLVIKINSHHLEITLCHETDLHVKYDVLTPLIEIILEHISFAFLTISRDVQPYTSPVFFSSKPVFIVSCDFDASDLRPTKIILEQWGKTLECSPKEMLRIAAYGFQSGSMTVEQGENSLKVAGWHSSIIRVYCDRQLLLDTKKLDNVGVV
jgi:hypothetical protein